jgi:hypothetical protein
MMLNHKYITEIVLGIFAIAMTSTLIYASSQSVLQKNPLTQTSEPNADSAPTPPQDEM